MAIACSIGGVGYLLLLVVHHNQRVRYFATFCICSGTYTTIGIIIAWCESRHSFSRWKLVLIMQIPSRAQPGL